MKLLTETQRRQLLGNAAQSGADPTPVVKLFNPLGQQRWLFTELAEDGDTLFGLCDLGHPELGYASLGDIAAIRVGFGLRIERDLHFRAKAPLSVYTEAAREAGRIVEFGSEFEAALARYEARQDPQARLSVWQRPGGSSMPRIVVTIVYDLDELSEAAKAHARAWYREHCMDHDWHAFVCEDFETVCGMLGVTLKPRPVPLMGGGTRDKPCIWFRGFWSHGAEPDQHDH